MIRIAAVCLVVAVVGGCSSGSDSGAEKDAAVQRQGPPPLAATERERGVTACERYAERVCACAEDDPELEQACALAGARPEALEMAIGAASAEGDLEPGDRAAARQTARQIIQKCFQADARLDPARCPRP